MPNAEQDRLALAEELQALLDAYAGEQADAAELGERPDLWDHVIEVPVSIVEAAVTELRVPAATDTAGAVERMRERCARVCDDDAAETRALEKASLSRATKDRWRTATMTATGIAKKIRALPATPDDPEAGDGGGR